MTTERQTDLEWLLSLGVPVENAAKRIARTPTAVLQELAATKAARDEGNE